MRKYLTYLLSTTVILMIAASLPAQQAADTTLPALRYESMTRNELMKLTYDDLLLIPLEDLLKICERLGVNMDDLLKLKTRNGSFETLTPRENPSMLSVITDEEIQNSGARNLADVLRMVPGYHVAYDIDGAMGLSTRGMWSMEGKILILVDGLEMNDLVYNSAEIGDRFNISEIKRIEIIRGPGSSIYGGSAELGVINIITKSGSDLNGISVSANYGRMERMTGRRTVNFAAGEKRNDVEYSLTGQLGDGTRSDGLWQNNFKIPPVVNDFKEGGAGFKNQNIHANLKFKDLEIKYIYNNYITDFTDSSDYYNDRFLNHSAEIKYTKKLSDKLSMIPRINVSYSEGYNTPDWETLRGVNRTQVSDNFKYDISETNFLLGGAGIYNDHGIMVDKSDTTMYYNGKNTINLYNTFGYMEYHASSPYIDLTIGGRIEYHNLFGLSYAPRVGLTKVINKFHYKFLFSKAYKTPSIGNLDYQHNLIPEDAYVMELELGYKLNDNMFITGTFFDITKLRNIVYWDSVTTAEYGYKLGGRTGSRGFEFDYRFRYLWGSLTLNYSYYFGAHKNTIAEYAIPGDLNKYLSAPQNKIAASLMINATEHISITPSLVFMGRRYGYNRWSADTTVLLIKEFDPALLVNIYINCRDVFVKGMNVGFGVYDLLNQKPPYIQPYYGSLPPFTAPSREIIVRLTYNFGFKEK